MLGGKGQAEEKEAGEAGQGAGVAGVRAQIQAGWYPEDLRGGVRSLWGLAGQLLLIEAHDMVHKLVLLAGLDHAAPAQQRHTVGMGMSRDGLWEGAPPNPVEYQSFTSGLVFIQLGAANPCQPLPSAPPCPSPLWHREQNRDDRIRLSQPLAFRPLAISLPSLSSHQLPGTSACSHQSSPPPVSQPVHTWRVHLPLTPCMCRSLPSAPKALALHVPLPRLWADLS